MLNKNFQAHHYLAFPQQKKQLQALHVPTNPGCYLFFDQQYRLLYVGKAKNLFKRVSSYLTHSQNQRVLSLVEHIRYFRFVICEHEKEALILEFNLIKKHHPKYNILLQDDKRYPYIVITKERHPRYLYTRKKMFQKAWFYYGPLPSGSKARELLFLLQELFPLRRCQAIKIEKPCFYYHLDLCLGACWKSVPVARYQAQIQQVKQFFAFQNNLVETKLRKKMDILADNLQFEQANKIKNLLMRLDWIRADQKAVLHRGVDLDFVSFCQQGTHTIFSILFFRQGHWVHQDFSVFNTQNTSLIFSARMFMQNIYHHNPLPSSIVVDDRLEITQLNLLLANKVRYAQTQLETAMLLKAQKTITGKWKTGALHSQVNHDDQKQQLALLGKLIGTNNPLSTICIFDISSWATQIVVGACAVFINGTWSREYSRRYRIEHRLLQPNDYYHTQLLVQKHLLAVVKQQQSLPDLIIVDGGIGHINAVRVTLTQMGLSLLVIGLSKDEQHHTQYLVTTQQKYLLIKYPLIKNWLAQMQTIVHQIALKYLHQVRYKKITTSNVLVVRGVSQRILSLLYQHFDDFSGMYAAGYEALNAIIKNKTTAASLWRWLKNNINFQSHQIKISNHK